MSRSSNHVDEEVGKRIRARRRELGLTLNDLAIGAGVNAQQIRKYELGENRVSASRLWNLASKLNVEIPYFFEELHEGSCVEPPKDHIELRAGIVDTKGDLLIPIPEYGDREKSLEQLLVLLINMDEKQRMLIKKVAESISAT